MNYEPLGVPLVDSKQTGARSIAEFLGRELRRIASTLKDNAPTVQYLTGPVVASLSDAISANWKAPIGNVVLMSTSSTITITGIADVTPNRVRTFINTGTGVVVFKSAGTESSAPYRLALPADWNLSAGAAATLWYDSFSARHRGLSRT
jgi:hypothetical protein